MNNKPNEQLDLLLDRATEALCSGQPSDAPPPELVTSTLERMRLLDSQPTTTTLEPDAVRLAERRQLMFRIARYSSAVAAAIVVAVFGWLFFADQTTAAFAGVIENVKKAESVTLTNNQKIGNGPAMTVKWYIQGEKVRMELPGAVAFVTDLGDKTTYELNLRDKTAKARPTPESGRQAFANPMAHLQNARPKDAKFIGQEKLAGDVELEGKEKLARRTVDLYSIERLDFLGSNGSGEMKVWVDPNTDLPVKIVMDNPLKERGSRTTLEFTDFVWNKELDDRLFQVPADFTITEDQETTEP